MRAALAVQDEEERAAAAALSQPEDDQEDAELTELYLMLAPLGTKDERAKLLEEFSNIEGRECPERTALLAYKRLLEATTLEEQEAECAKLAALAEQAEAERAATAALAQQQEVERAAMAALADQEEVDERAARAAISDRWKMNERAREAALSIQEGGECAESAALPDGGVERASVAALPHHPENSEAEGQEETTAQEEAEAKPQEECEVEAQEELDATPMNALHRQRPSCSSGSGRFRRRSYGIAQPVAQRGFPYDMQTEETLHVTLYC